MMVLTILPGSHIGFSACSQVCCGEAERIWISTLQGGAVTLRGVAQGLRKGIRRGTVHAEFGRQEQGVGGAEHYKS